MIGLLHRREIEQAGEIGDMQVHRIGDIADVGKAVAALVVEDDGEVARKPHDDIAPDAEIGAERIGKDKHRLVIGSADDLIMKRDVVDVGKLHWNSPPPPDWSFNLVR